MAITGTPVKPGTESPVLSFPASYLPYLFLFRVRYSGYYLEMGLVGTEPLKEYFLNHRVTIL